MKLKRIGRGCNMCLFGLGTVKTGDVIEVKDDLGTKLVTGEPDGWSADMDVEVSAPVEVAAETEAPRKKGMKAFTRLIIALGALLAF